MSVADAGMLSLDSEGGRTVSWDRPSQEEVRELIEATGMSYREIAEEMRSSVDAVQGWLRTANKQGEPLQRSSISGASYTLLLLLADQHPQYRLTKRRKPL